MHPDRIRHTVVFRLRHPEGSPEEAAFLNKHHDRRRGRRSPMPPDLQVARFMSLHNEAFRDVWGEAVVSREEAIEVMARARLAIDPSLFQFAVADGEDIGMVLCMTNVNEVIAPQHATLTSPSGVWKMATRRRRAKTVGLLSVGVLPEHQSRGIGTALVARACRAAARRGFRRMEYALVAESNDASKSTAERFGGKLCRRYGVYRKEL